MQKLSTYPYHVNEKNFHGHIMTMGSLQLLIIKAFKEKQLSENVEIRMVECDSGDVTTYSINEWTLHDSGVRHPYGAYDRHRYGPHRHQHFR